MVSGYFVKNKMSKDNKIYSNLSTKKKTNNVDAPLLPRETS